MYQPVVKNKLNELKGLNNVSKTTNFSPIIEITELNKKNTITQVLNYIVEKLEDILTKKNIYIDVPTYLENEFYKYFELDNIENKYELFLEAKNIFEAKDCTFVPVISFDYSYDSEKKSYRENIKILKKIMKTFDNFALRIFSNDTFRKNDEILISQIFDFLGDELEEKNITVIIDINKKNRTYALEILDETIYEYNINQITLIGEAFNNDSRAPTANTYDRIKNHHLINFNNFKNFTDKKLVYGDYTLVDKIPNKIEIDPLKGFLYYPFIKFTTEDGNMCYFSAKERGNYHQYQGLCDLVIKEIREYSEEHCTTCKFIKDVAEGKITKFKTGATWKYRMIAHHVTTMSKLQTLNII